ncbi:MAG: molybdopterin-dependent oxidoreductase [Chloroflexi bacterium]|nr:molybdopterin-dependent oxidoreductase [Chloroflexota bacterium]
MQTSVRGASYGANDKWVQSVCKMCLHGCGIRVQVRDGVILKIEGDPTNPDNLGKLCAKGQAGLMRQYDPNRFKSPLKRTNPKKGPGVDPKWEEVSWDEALDTVTQKLKECREKDPRNFIAVIGDFQKQSNWGWGAAYGSGNYFRGQFCGAAYHPINGLLDASFASVNDYLYCNYWIQIGAGDGFSSHLHLAGSAKRMADARVDRGMKVVVVEPRMSQAAAKADQWIPIRPATDRAFVLGMMNVMVHELGQYDKGFLKKHTNAPYLIGPDGYFARDKASNKALVWDSVENQAKTWDDPSIKDFALEGNYSVNDVTCRPGFQIFKTMLEEHSPERMSEICTVPAATIRRIAREFVEAARIGSTIVIEGKEYPYRPAALDFYRGATGHKDGGWDSLTYKLANLLVGNIDIPGGHLGVPLDPRGFAFWVAPGEDGMLGHNGVHMLHPARPFSFPPNTTHLSEYFPIGTDAGQLSAETILNPKKFNLNFDPDVMMLYHANPMWHVPATRQVQKAFEKMKFIFAIDVVPSESNEWADVILPDHTCFESTALVSVEPPVVVDYALRQPVVPPMYNTRDATDILTDLADRVGFLGVWNDLQNFIWGLVRTPQYMLAPDKKYSVEEICDRAAKSRYGESCGLEWFKEHGHRVRYMTAKEQYMPYGELRIPFYFDYVKKIGDELRAKLEPHGVEWDYSGYVAVPYWRSSPVHDAPSKYDLYAIGFKTAELNFAENLTIPWIYELVGKVPAHQGVLINPATAKARGISDGDMIVIESVQDEIIGIAKLTEGMQPETIGISNGITRWVYHPTIKARATHFNALLPASLEYTDYFTGAVETTARVSVRRLER